MFWSFKRVFLLSVFIVVCSAFLFGYWKRQTQDDPPVLRIGFQHSPPYQIIGEDGSISGIAIDLIRKAAANQGIELDWRYSPKSPDHHMAHDEVDLWPVITSLPERLQEIYITKPIYENSVGMLSLTTTGIRKPSDMKDKRLAYYDREPGISYVNRLFPFAKLIPLSSNEAAIRSVFEEQADAAFLWSTKSNSILFKQTVNQHPEKAFHFHFFEKIKLTCGIGANRRSPGAIAAADRLREEVRKLATDGTVQAIYFQHYLDPENEISSYFYVNNLERRNWILGIVFWVVLGCLVAMVLLSIQLRRSRKAAQAANASKSTFLANMSHEIRTPLNGVLSMTELALTTSLTDDQRDLLSTAHQSADALLTVVNDILDFSKLEAHKLLVVSESVQISKLLGSSIRLFEAKAHQRELALIALIGPVCPTSFLGDGIRLQQVLNNLIGNAIKYTETGSIQVRARCVVEKGIECLVLEVADTGIGIARDKLETIFRVFEQVDSSSTRRYGGTGLGLSICRNLVSLMGGRIEVESELGIGSTFRVVMPIQVPDTSEQQGDEETSTPATSEAVTTPLRILLVDDNPINLKIGRTVLERYHHLCNAASDGLEAVEQATTEQFDVILMDIQMPRMDGYEATRAIRKWEAEHDRPSTPIVALTACVLDREADKCRDAGMDAFLGKPLRVNELMSQLNRITSFVAEGEGRPPG